MMKIIKLLLLIIVLFTFTACGKKAPIQTVVEENIIPTAEITPSETPGKASKNVKDVIINNGSNVAGGSQPDEDLIYSRTTQENKEYYEEVENEKDELYSIETPDYIYYYDGFFCDLVYAADKKEGRTLYFLNGDCIFIMTSEEIGPTYDYYIETGDPVYQSFEALIYIDELKPFSNEVVKVLPEQIGKILSGGKITLPTNYYLLDYCEGDLNSDGQNDLAAVVEQAPGLYTGSRVIYVFLQNNGVYEPAFENMSIVLGRGEGGVFGDPYSGISIKEGILHIRDYGGSNYRWSHDYTFTYQNNKLIISKIEETNYYTGTSYGTTDYYDLINAAMESRTYFEADSEDAPYNNLLLYSGKINNPGEICFEDAYAWCNYDFTEDPGYIRPDLAYYEYGQCEYQSVMQRSPEEILDLVQQKYYPDMRKVDLQLSEEIINNYQLLLGYRIPTYYYTDGEYVLSYFGFSYLDVGDGRYVHNISYKTNDNNWDEYKSYDYWDDTGTERTF